MARSVSQLKEEARRAEQREEWSRAIDLYLEALRISEESGDISLDLSLYNRIGDLYRRGGNTDEAVSFYRKAVEQYAEQGLHTGAVALCNKILRLAPDQVDTYRILGRLHASSGLAAEARNAFGEYVERMEERGDRAAAQDGRLELARRVEDVELLSDVVEEMVAEGREEDARSAVRGIWQEQQEGAGDADPEVRELAERMDVVEGPPADAPDEGAAEGAADGEPDASGTPEAEAEEDAGSPAESPGDAGADGEPPGPDGTEQAAASTEGADEEEATDEDAEGVELEEILLHDPGGAGRSGGEAADAPPEDEREADGEGQDDAEAPAAGTAPGPPEADESPSDGPSDAGDGAAVGGGPATEPGPDEGPAPSPPPEADEPVDLGERIRRRLEGEPGAGEAPVQGDFDDMLVGFRAEAAETSGEADPEAHVELGVALRQMGLVDDAIREFQVAARAPEPPVRAFELLGECFLEKDLHSVAVRVLNRALRLPGHPDHELLGVLYQLGVAYQSVEEHAEALDCYERVFSVDIDFRDVGERMEEVRSGV